VILEPQLLKQYRDELAESIRQGDYDRAVDLTERISEGRIAQIVRDMDEDVVGLVKGPALVTGPVLTTITDITGVSIYLGLSTLFLFSLLIG